ncbi:MAG: hypothetical protein LAT64_13865 [Phycisphaerales bacterium]|nr:hypothetical protein [Planctomycetota bacterium]MCH8509836.1 hypothetical protein [Phycisphaerales bacterium]
MDTIPNTPACQHCRYDLTGLRVEDRCPECGEPVWSDIEARVQSLIPSYARFETSFYAALLALLMSFACGPFGVLMAVWALIQSWMAVRDRGHGVRPVHARNMPFVSLILSAIALLISIAAGVMFLLAI